MESGLYIYPVFKMALKTDFTPLYVNKIYSILSVCIDGVNLSGVA